MSDLQEIKKQNCKYIDTYNEYSIYDLRNTELWYSHSDYVVVNNITGYIVDEGNNLREVVNCIDEILLNRLN